MLWDWPGISPGGAGQAEMRESFSLEYATSAAETSFPWSLSARICLALKGGARPAHKKQEGINKPASGQNYSEVCC